MADPKHEAKNNYPISHPVLSSNKAAERLTRAILVRAMLQNGMTVEQIAQVAGLAKEEVEAFSLDR